MGTGFKGSVTCRMEKNLLVQEGTEGQTSNVSSYVNSGKISMPLPHCEKTNNLMYDAGYSWCEAHYLNPIAITHFRITTSNPNDLNTSIIYQNPGWPSRPMKDLDNIE